MPVVSLSASEGLAEHVRYDRARGMGVPKAYNHQELIAAGTSRTAFPRNKPHRCCDGA